METLILDACRSINDEFIIHGFVNRISRQLQSNQEQQVVIEIFRKLWTHGSIPVLYNNNSSNQIDTSSSSFSTYVPSALTLLQLARYLPEISDQAIILCLGLINEGKFAGRNSIHCLAEIQSAIATSTLTSSSTTTPNSNSNVLRRRVEFIMDIAEISIKPYHESNFNNMNNNNNNNSSNNSSSNTSSTGLLLELLPLIMNTLAAIDRNMIEEDDEELLYTDKVLNMILSSSWKVSAFVPLGNALCDIFEFLNTELLNEVFKRYLENITRLQGDDFAASMQIYIRFYKKTYDYKWLHGFRYIFSKIPKSSSQTVELLLEQILLQYPIECQHMLDLVEDLAIKSARQNIQSDSDVTFSKDNIELIPISYHDIRLILNLSRVRTYPQHANDCLPALIGYCDEATVNAVRVSRCLITTILCGAFINRIDCNQDVDLQDCLVLLQKAINNDNSHSSSSSSSSSSLNSDSSAQIILDSTLLGSMRTAECMSALFFATSFGSSFTSNLDFVHSIFSKSFDIDQYKFFIGALFAYLFKYTRSAQSTILSNVIRGLIMCAERLKVQGIDNKNSMETIDLQCAYAILHNTLDCLCDDDSLDTLMRCERTIVTFVPNLVELALIDLEIIAKFMSSVCKESRLIFDNVLTTYRKCLIKPTHSTKIASICGLVRLIPALPLVFQKETANVLLHCFNMSSMYIHTFLVEMVEMLNKTNTNLDNSMLRSIQERAIESLIDFYNGLDNIDNVNLSATRCLLSFRSTQGVNYVIQRDIGMLLSLSWLIELRLDKENSIKKCEFLIQYLFAEKDDISSFDSNVANDFDSELQNESASIMLLGMINFVKKGLYSQELSNRKGPIDLDSFQAHIACCESVLSGLSSCFIATRDLVDNNIISKAVLSIGCLIDLLFDISKEKLQLNTFKSFNQYSIGGKTGSSLDECVKMSYTIYRQPIVSVHVISKTIVECISNFDLKIINNSNTENDNDQSKDLENKINFLPISSSVGCLGWATSQLGGMVERMNYCARIELLMLLETLRKAHESVTCTLREKIVLEKAMDAAGRAFDVHPSRKITKGRSIGVRRAVSATENRSKSGHSLYAEISDLSDFGESDNEGDMTITTTPMSVAEKDDDFENGDPIIQPIVLAAIDLNADFVSRVTSRLPKILQANISKYDLIGLDKNSLSRRRHMTAARDTVRYRLFSVRQELLFSVYTITSLLLSQRSLTITEASKEALFWTQDLRMAVQVGLTQKTAKAYIKVIEILAPNRDSFRKTNSDSTHLSIHHQIGTALIEVITYLNGVQPSLLQTIIRTAIRYFTLSEATHSCAIILKSAIGCVSKTKKTKTVDPLTVIKATVIDNNDAMEIDKEEDAKLEEKEENDVVGGVEINQVSKVPVLEKSVEVVDLVADEDNNDNIIKIEERRLENVLDYITDSTRECIVQETLASADKLLSAMEDLEKQHYDQSTMTTYPKTIEGESILKDLRHQLELGLSNISTIISDLLLVVSDDKSKNISSMKVVDNNNNNNNNNDDDEAKTLMIERFTNRCQSLFLHILNRYSKQFIKALKVFQTQMISDQAVADEPHTAIRRTRDYFEFLKLRIKLMKVDELTNAKGWMSRIKTKYPKLIRQTIQNLDNLRSLCHNVANIYAQILDDHYTFMKKLNHNSKKWDNIENNNLKNHHQKETSKNTLRNDTDDMEIMAANADAILGDNQSRGSRLSQSSRKRSRLRSRNSVIDRWLDGETGKDTFADLEGFIVESGDEESDIEIE